MKSTILTLLFMGLASVGFSQAPVTNPEAPESREAENVISLYGAAYDTISGINYDPNWGQSGHNQVNTEFDPGTGQFILAYPNFNYQGTDFSGNPFNASDMEFLHIDIFVPAGTDRMVKVSPIDNSGVGPGEVLVEVPVTPGEWNRVNIPTSSFTNMSLNSVFQLKFDGQFNSDGSANTAPFDVYLDNIFFWKNEGGGTDPDPDPDPDPPVEGDIVINGDFDEGLASWTPFVADFAGVSATIAAVDGEATITNIAGAGGEIWHIQLNQILTAQQLEALEVGESYKVQFDARSDVDGRQLRSFFGEEGGGFAAVNIADFNLSTSMETYETTFVINQKYNAMKLGFEMGLSNANVFIDNVSLMLAEAGGDPDPDPDPVPVAPVVAAPTPAENAGSVISMFADVFDDVPVDTWRTPWSQAVLEEVTIDGNNMKKYTALNFVGIETVTNQIDASEMEFFHIDVWTPNMDVVRVKLVDFGPSGELGGDDSEHEITFTNLTKGEWNSLQIPMSDFTGLLNRSNLAQLILSGTPTGQATLFVTNVYFSGEDAGEGPPSLSAEPYTQQFRDFVSAETLPSGWSVSSTGTEGSTNYNGDWGSGTEAGLRGSSSVLGFQHSSNTGRFTAKLEMVNNTGNEINNLYLYYTGRVERIDESNTPDWLVQVNGNPVAALNFSTSDGFESSKTGVVSGLSIADGDMITIEWDSNTPVRSGTARQIGISDVVVSADPFFAASILGSQGFRILASPGENATYGEVLSNIWTQGFAGSNYNLGSSNVFIYDETTRTFPIPTSAGNRMGTTSDTESSAGKASLVFVYADENRNQIDELFPKLLLYSGVVNTGDISLDLSYTDTGNPGSDGWHMVGNPYNSSLNWGSITANNRNDNISDIFYIYDSEIDAYRLINGVPEEPGDIQNPNSLLAPHQGGWVKVFDDAGGTLEITPADISTGSTELFTNPDQIPFVRLNLSAGDRGDYAAVVFREDTIAELDRRDAYQLSPMTSRYAHIYTRTSDSYFMVKNLPYTQSEYLIPVGINSTIAESHILSWNDLDALPYEWNVYLTDQMTGERINLRETDSYTFEHSPESGTSASLSLIESIAQRTSPVMTQENTSPERFLLEITTATTSVPLDGLPGTFALSQNYPNPFNPTTQISYDLPETADVRLEVFNIQGQRVAVLVSETQNAGTHNLSFNASRLASGVYIYRLQAGSHTFTKKMTLIK
ncbi:MAG: T9SS type A sorting domain-containing protein [Balneolales bacterium]|nr:T9SS type A sorting domain-containing protein [Balneolales bacterium]